MFVDDPGSDPDGDVKSPAIAATFDGAKSSISGTKLNTAAL